MIPSEVPETWQRPKRRTDRRTKRPLWSIGGNSLDVLLSAAPQAQERVEDPTQCRAYAYYCAPTGTWPLATMEFIPSRDANEHHGR